MQQVELWIVALSESVSQPGQFALVLEEPVSRRRIPLLIGGAEARAIAIALERLQPARPLTHDLFQTTLRALGASLEEVRLTRFEAEVFYAELVLRDHAGHLLALDARPSDAIALAVRCSCPLYAGADLLAAAAYAPDEATPDQESTFLAFTVPELEEELRQTLEKQDYERAARVRNALDRRAERAHNPAGVGAWASVASVNDSGLRTIRQLAPAITISGIGDVASQVAGGIVGRRHPVAFQYPGKYGLA